MKTCTLANRMAKGLVFLVLLTGFSLTGYAQMKIGNNPTDIHRASILELESPNQALRLTQGDTAAVNTVISNETGVTDIHDTTQAAVNAAEGMIMLQRSDHTLYMRIGGYWRQIVSSMQIDSTFWRLGGNTGSDSSFLGTTDNQPLTIGTNNNGYLIIHGDGTMDVLADSTYFANPVTINDSLRVGNAFKVTDSVFVNNGLVINDSVVIHTALREALPTDSSVLILSSTGVLRKISLDSLLSQGIRSINGVSGTNIHLRFGVDAGTVRGPWIDSTSAAADSMLILNIPSASGATNMAIRGLVDTLAQSFAGSKSFRDSVAIGKTTTPNSTFQVNGNVSMADTTVSVDYDMTTPSNGNFRTIICDVSGKPASPTSPTITVTLPAPTGLDGRIYTFKKIGDNTSNQINAYVLISGTFGSGGDYEIYNNWSSVTVQARGTFWYIVGR